MGSIVANKTSFAKGDGRKRKTKGDISDKTKIQKLVKSRITEIAQGFDGEGIGDLWEELNKLRLKDRVFAKLQLLEYVMPKLGRIEVINKPENKVISVFGKLVENTNDEITDIEHTEIE